jgi:hypothetical protein
MRNELLPEMVVNIGRACIFFDESQKGEGILRNVYCGVNYLQFFIYDTHGLPFIVREVYFMPEDRGCLKSVDLGIT